MHQSLPDPLPNPMQVSRVGTPAGAAPLEDMLECVEAELAALGESLRLRDSAAIEQHAELLQRALALAVDDFSRAARSSSGIPSLLRKRLVKASGQVAAQRESLLRATVALDRAIEALIPRDNAPVYGQRQMLAHPYGR
jgi:hypothetical protein